MIAALGIYAIALQAEQGYQLRSRCQLIPTAKPEFEWIGSVASNSTKTQIASEVAREALRELYATAKAAGLAWEEQRIALTPEEKLVKLRPDE